MASHGLFVDLCINFGVSFGFSGCFRSGNIYSGVVYFFCVIIFFFVLLRDDLVLLFSLHFLLLWFGG